MKQRNKHLTSTLLIVAGLLTSTTTASAFDADQIEIHGALSGTFMASDTYNLVSETKDSLELSITEITLNGQTTFENGVRVGAQVYASTYLDETILTLDWAMVEYTVSDLLTIQAGRVKRMRGLYNEYQDIDAAFTHVIPPSSVYPRVNRSITNAIDGISFSGAVDLSDFGSVNYQLYGGIGPNMNHNNPVIVSMQQSFYHDITGINIEEMYGAGLNWETPIDGLTFHLDQMHVNISTEGEVLNAMDFFWKPDLVRFFPVEIGFETWNNSGLFAGTNSSMEAELTDTVIGLEYSIGEWVFAAEYFLQELDSTLYSDSPALPEEFASTTESDGGYIAATRQLTDRLSAEVYYSVFYDDKNDRDGDNIDESVIPKHTAWRKDLAIAFKYDLTDYWTIKAEYHHVNGTSDIVNNDGRNGDPLDWNEDYNYAAVKTTFMF